MEDIRYYNRYTGREEREQVLGEKYMQWIYGTASGKAALHVLIKRGVFSRLLGWLKNRPSSARSIPSFVEEYGINMEDSLKGVGSSGISTIFLPPPETGSSPFGRRGGYGRFSRGCPAHGLGTRRPN